MLEIISIKRSLANGPLHGSAVFRMGALENELHGWLRRPITFEDSKRLIRPDDLSALDIPSEASSTGQSLRFGQVHFAAQQRGFTSLLVLDRNLQFVAGLTECYRCFSLRRDHKCKGKRYDGKQR